MLTGKILRCIGAGMSVCSVIGCFKALIGNPDPDSAVLLILLVFLGVLAGLLIYGFGLIVSNSCRITEILESLSGWDSRRTD